MPEICRFYGIIIYMYVKDHAPPHFHAKCGGDMAVIDVKTGHLIEGYIPRTALRLVEGWAKLHKDELLANWEESQKDHPSFFKIQPLE